MKSPIDDVPAHPSHRGANADATYQQIRDAIISGQFHSGETLTESQLADWCQVSRTPVREALMQLSHDGLVRKVGRRYTVRESSPDEILDLYEVRIVLEQASARMSAERRTDYDLTLMRISHEQVATLLSDPERMAKVNQSFHKVIWRASHNDALIDLLERLSLRLGRYPATTLALSGRPAQAHEEHRRLITAIEDRDADAAAQIAQEHFTTARDIRLRLWSAQSLTDGP